MEESEPKKQKLAELKVTELKDELRARGLSPSGKKSVLIERLEQDLQGESAGAPGAAPAAPAPAPAAESATPTEDVTAGGGTAATPAPAPAPAPAAPVLTPAPVPAPELAAGLEEAVAGVDVGEQPCTAEARAPGPAPELVAALEDAVHGADSGDTPSLETATPAPAPEEAADGGHPEKAADGGEEVPTGADAPSAPPSPPSSTPAPDFIANLDKVIAETCAADSALRLPLSQTPPGLR
eukprot:scaffold20418_cov112-Isochrysis_galbana.AAC.3